jgi:hypothetical protein
MEIHGAKSDFSTEPVTPHCCVYLTDIIRDGRYLAFPRVMLLPRETPGYISDIERRLFNSSKITSIEIPATIGDGWTG